MNEYFFNQLGTEEYLTSLSNYLKMIRLLIQIFIYFSGESEFLKSHGQKNFDANLNRQHMNPTSNGRPYFASIGKTYRIRNGYTVTLECSIENIGKIILLTNFP